MRGVVLFGAQRAPRTIGPRHRGNRPVGLALARTCASRPTAGSPTGFAGKWAAGVSEVVAADLPGWQPGPALTGVHEAFEPEARYAAPVE